MKRKLIFIFAETLIFSMLFIQISAEDLSGSKSLKEKNYFEGFGTYIEHAMDQWDIPGAVIGVVKDNKVIFLEGFGYRDKEKKLPVDSRTLFCIGSCTKAFTATAVGMLVAEKKLKWNLPIKNMIPGIDLYDDFTSKYISAKDLLIQRTGISGHDMVKDFNPIGREGLFKVLKYLKPNKSFREGFQYANINYAIAAYLVDRSSGNSYEEYVDQNIFKPLGMNSSTFSIDKFQSNENSAQPYLTYGTAKVEDWGEARINQRYFEINKSYNNLSAASGGIYSNAEDMIEWLKFNLNQGKVKNDQILPKEILRTIHTPYMGLKYYPDSKESKFLAYGMGWFIDPYRGHYRIRHSGQVYGYMSEMSFMPEEKIGIIVMTNMYYHIFHENISKNIYDRLLGLNIIDRNENSVKGLNNYIESSLKKDFLNFWSKKPEDAKLRHNLNEYQGDYKNPGYGNIRIVLKDNELQVILKDQFKLQLLHYKENTFATKSDIWNYNHKIFKFQKNDKGEIISLAISLEPSVDDIIFVRNN